MGSFCGEFTFETEYLCTVEVLGALEGAGGAGRRKCVLSGPITRSAYADLAPCVGTHLPVVL